MGHGLSLVGGLVGSLIVGCGSTSDTHGTSTAGASAGVAAAGNTGGGGSDGINSHSPGGTSSGGAHDDGGTTGALATSGTSSGGSSSGNAHDGGSSSGNANEGGATTGGARNDDDAGAAGADDEGGPVVAMSVGYSHACALAHDNVYCWGWNAAGQLGVGSEIDSPLPVMVQGLGAGISAISAGYYHTCALVAGGVWCWGLNEHGQLGDGTKTTRTTAVQVKGLGSNVTSISAGANHTCALVGDAVYCWGNNTMGELGDGTTDDKLAPEPVSGLSAGASAVAAGEYQTCFLVADDLTMANRVLCSGQNTAGHWDLVPAVVTGTTGASFVTTGGNEACALIDDEAYCWGLNMYGQLGDDSTTDSPEPVIVDAPNDLIQLTDIMDLSAGAGRACTVAAGAAYCWGFNFYGELGDGTRQERHLPTPVAGLRSGVTAIDSGGAELTCALKKGLVYCWSAGNASPAPVCPTCF